MANPLPLRRATADEAAEVARLLRAFNQEFSEPVPSLEALTARLGELLGKGVLTAILAGDPAQGFALLRIHPAYMSEREEAYLAELYVAPERRGEGTGRALLEEAMDLARSAGADHFDLTTGTDDRAARALYESAGLTNREGGLDGPSMLYYERDL